MACCLPGSSKNTCRALSRFIYNEGLSLKIDLIFVPVTCRRRKPYVQDHILNWPVLSMRIWFNFLFANHPQLLLGGHPLDGDWPEMFGEFWTQWHNDEPQHAVYSSGKPLKLCLPFFTHGDEGQTTRKTPFMVQSFQPAISWKGMSYTTLSGSLWLNLWVWFLRWSSVSRIAVTVLAKVKLL